MIVYGVAFESLKPKLYNKLEDYEKGGVHLITCYATSALAACFIPSRSKLPLPQQPNRSWRTDRGYGKRSGRVGTIGNDTEYLHV